MAASAGAYTGRWRRLASEAEAQHLIPANACACGVICTLARRRIIDFREDRLLTFAKKATIAAALRVNMRTGFAIIPELRRDYDPDQTSALREEIRGSRYYYPEQRTRASRAGQ